MSGAGATARQLDDEAKAFAERFEPAPMRWTYVNATMTAHDGGFLLKGAATAERFLGIRCTPTSIRRRLRMMRDFGYDRAHEIMSRYSNGLSVGTLPAWCVGHIYFVHVESHPHVTKIGFSRRVHERLEDLEAKCGVRLVIDALAPGTLLDEYHCHDRCKSSRISGEWFFAPDTDGRWPLPDFLADAAHPKSEAA